MALRVYIGSAEDREASRSQDPFAGPPVPR